MKEFELPKRTLLLWQIRFSLGWLVLSVFTYILSYDIKTFLICFSAITLFSFISILFYLPKYYLSFKIKCLKDAVVVEKGVFIKKCHILPFLRLIYSQTLNTPLSKPFGVTALTLKAARSFIFVPEMLDEDAKELLTILVKGDVL